MKGRVILALCGDFHRYQFILLALFGYVCLITSANLYSQSIIAFTPTHYCYDVRLVGLNQSEVQKAYANVTDPHCTRLPGEGVNASSKCDRWMYFADYGYNSITQQFDWVCANAYRKTVGQTMFFVGSMFGRLLFGTLAGQVGRLKVLAYAIMMTMLGNVLTVFSNQRTIGFAASRFVTGIGTDSNFLMMMILGELSVLVWK